MSSQATNSNQTRQLAGFFVLDLLAIVATLFTKAFGKKFVELIRRFTSLIIG